MNAQIVRYRTFWGEVLFETNFWNGMPIPNNGFHIYLPNHSATFEVDRVVFNIKSATIEVVVQKLS